MTNKRPITIADWEKFKDLIPTAEEVSLMREDIKNNRQRELRRAIS